MEFKSLIVSLSYSILKADLYFSFQNTNHEAAATKNTGKYMNPHILAFLWSPHAVKLTPATVRPTSL